MNPDELPADIFCGSSEKMGILAGLGVKPFFEAFHYLNK